MRGSIIYTCGHKFYCGEDANEVDVICKSETCDAIEGFLPALSYETWCGACAAERTPNPDWGVFASEEEADKWLDSEAAKCRT